MQNIDFYNMTCQTQGMSSDDDSDMDKRDNVGSVDSKAIEQYMSK